MINNEIIKEKVKDYYIVQNNVRDNNNEYQTIKKQTNQINKEILKVQNDIDKINLEIKLINKNIIDDEKLCDKMRKEIKYYNNHSQKLKHRLNILDENFDIIEEVINQMNENHI